MYDRTSIEASAKVEIIASSISINLALRSRTDASLENSDAESLVSGFRRVLRGVCDGEVLLDNRMEARKSGVDTTG